MDEDKKSDSKQSNDVDMHEKYKKHRMVALLTLLFMLGGLIGVSLLYYSAANNSADKDDLIVSLQDKIETNRIETDEFRNAQENTAEEPATATPIATEADQADCSGGSDITAEVGKFKLELPDPYVITRSVDGGFEGGPITRLSVGKCADGNIVDLNAFGSIEITGHPNSDSANLRTSRESEAVITADVVDTYSFDGVSVDALLVGGFGSGRAVYFDNNGIGYELFLSFDGDESLFEDIAGGWTFTP